jgi:20S proteasome subunit alpha 5
LHIL